MRQIIPPAAYLDPDRPVDFTQDGLSLSPVETARLLQRIGEERGIERDLYLAGGAVEELERRLADMLGKEAGLYAPTGTLANHLAITALTRQGDRVVVDATSHLARDAGDGLPRWAGRSLIRVEDERAGFSPAALEQVLNEAASGKVPVTLGAIALESPMRRRLCAVIAPERFSALIQLARAHTVPVHLDAARLFTGCAWTDQSPAAVASRVDTLYISLWKCFNAPSGALLVGSRSLIEPLRSVRRSLGGCPPTAWINAAIALAFLEEGTAPLERARAAGDLLIQQLEAQGHLCVERVIDGTSIILLSKADPDAPNPAPGEESISLRLPPLDDLGRLALKINPTLVDRPLASVAQAIATNFPA